MDPPCVEPAIAAPGSDNVRGITSIPNNGGWPPSQLTPIKNNNENPKLFHDMDALSNTSQLKWNLHEPSKSVANSGSSIGVGGFTLHTPLVHSNSFPNTQRILRPNSSSGVAVLS